MKVGTLHYVGVHLDLKTLRFDDTGFSEKAARIFSHSHSLLGVTSHEKRE